MTSELSGNIAKMHSRFDRPVQYKLPFGNMLLAMNDLIGEVMKLTHTGKINCIQCGRETKKSFNQGYCFPCFRKLAQCDICIVKPELCHYHQGTCREPQWANEHCMQRHVVYLANTSGLKIGITRSTQIPTRWIDQGAYQALPIFSVQSRYQSGLIEVAFKSIVNDKTDWRRMLKNEVKNIELEQRRDELKERLSREISDLENLLGIDAVEPIFSETITEIQYPVQEYPKTIKSFNLDKDPVVTGQLQGIKGQYLIFDTGVINIRKFAGYHLTLKIQ